MFVALSLSNDLINITLENKVQRLIPIINNKNLISSKFSTTKTCLVNGA